MKILIDQNLSRSLVTTVSAHFPGSTHVAHVALDAAEDSVIWEFALLRDFAILTKDSDFFDLSVIRGAPPLVIWLKVGNLRTKEIAEILTKRLSEIAMRAAEPGSACIELSG